MTRRKWMVLLVCALVLTAGRAHAGTLVAGPVEVEDDGYLVCLIGNLGNKELKGLTVRRMLDNDITSDAQIVPPGGSVRRDNLNVSGSVQIGWCVFNFKGSKRKVTATACAEPAAGGPCITPVPAR